MGQDVFILLKENHMSVTGFSAESGINANTFHHKIHTEKYPTYKPFTEEEMAAICATVRRKIYNLESFLAKYENAK